MWTACLSFLWLVVKGVVVLDNKDFMILASGAAAYYFGYKGNTNGPDSPMAGK